MRRITRNIDPLEGRDLLARVPQACIAFAGTGDSPRAEPITVVSQNERYLVGMPSQGPTPPAVGEEVVLLIDEGFQFFDLRAIYVRGRVDPADEAERLSDDLSWFAVVPSKIVAWDYGRMREVEDAS
jgi:hypothetical protein